MRKITWVGALLVCLAVEPAGRAATPDFSVVPATTGDCVKGKPGIAFDGVNFLCGWQKGSDIYVTRVSPGGSVLDPEGIAISVGLNQASYPPSVGFDGTNYLIAWCATRGGVSEIYGARLTPAGEVLDPGGVKLTSGSNTEIRMPGIAFDGQNFLIVWRTLKAGGNNILGVLVSKTATTVSAAAGFPIANLNCSYYPAVAFDGTNYLVVWHDSRGADWNVYGARVTTAGTVLEPNGFLICGDPMHQEHCNVAFDGTNYLVVWYDWRPNNDKVHGSAYGARVSPAGTVLDSPAFKIADHVRGEVAVQVAYDGSNFLALWAMEYPTTYPNWRLTDVYGRRIAKNGALFDRQPIPFSTSFGHQFGPVLGYGAGKYFAAWGDGRNYGTSTRVYGNLVPSSAPAEDLPVRTTSPVAAGWTAETIGTRGAMFTKGVATAPEEAYVFGPSEIVRFSAGRWSPVGSFTGGSPYAAWASGPQDVWAGGWASALSHYDGQAWTNRGCWNQNIVTGLWGVDARHVWATCERGQILELDSASNWNRRSVGVTADLQAIWGTSATDLYVVGEKGTIVHFNGTTWTPVAGVPTDQTLNAIWGSGPKDIFVVGDSGAILHFDGAAWTAQESCTTNHLFGVTGFSPTDVYAVGMDGTILHFDGVRWEAQESGTALDLMTVFGAYDETTNLRTVWTAGAGDVGHVRRIAAPFEITRQPASQTVTRGQSVTLAVAASGPGVRTYRWIKDGSAVGGAMEATYSITNVQRAQAGTYTCVVTSGAGQLTSTPAELVVEPNLLEPAIIGQPASHAANPGGRVSFAVTATGQAPLQYVWQRQAAGESAWTDLADGAASSGTHTATLVVTAALTMQRAQFRCVVSNAEGEATSDAAVLRVLRTITASSDLDGDAGTDVMWREGATLEVGSWTTSGGYVRVGAEDGGYAVIGFGDFDGDGRSEAVWRHAATGALVAWPSGGGTLSLGTNGSTWQVLGQGDFDGDRRTELLWRDAATAEIGTWTATGVFVHLGSETTGWQVIGVADVDGDGKTEPVWRQASSTEIGSWTMAGAYVRLGAENGAWEVVGFGDFDGDGTGEPLWRDRGTRDVAAWTIAGGFVQVGREDNGWTIIGTGDFDADGRTEGLWRNANTLEIGTWTMAGAYLRLGSESGAWQVIPQWPVFTNQPVARWLASGASALLSVTVTANPPPVLQWQVSVDGSTWTDVADGGRYSGAATTSLTIANANRSMNGNRYRCVVRNGAGRAISAVAMLNVSARAGAANDLDGDGKTDVLWRYVPLQELGIWNSSGFVHLGTEGTGWVVIGVGDFDADGKMELIWRHTGSGQVATWPSGGGYVPLGTESAWQVIQIGDFDGDGRSELLWRHSGTGQVVTWTQAGAYLELGAETDGWRVIGIADFDGDGRQEPAWRNTNTFEIRTTTTAGETIRLGTEGGGWTVTAFGDVDGDGKAEPFWRHASTLENVTWTRAGGFVRLGTESSGGWHVIAVGDYDGDGRSEPLWQHETTRELATWPSGGGYLPLGAESGNWVVSRN
jgi:hypothetical protein